MSDKNPSRKAEFRLSTPVRLGVAAVAACFIAGPVLSNPVNPTVVNGTATFNQTGNVLTVTNSNGAIINWQQFNIGAGETTHFAQASASSSVLNRVLANDPSLIYGTLSSNGRVWLVNPAGIMVGAGGRVDVAGFVASTLNISNADFLAGRNLFVNDGTAQNVINQGEIRTPSGGSVYLIGSNVTNEGLIQTPAGETILAAGQTVSLIDSATPGVKVDITGAAGNATNLGTITAEAGRIGIAGVIVRNSGLLNASSVVSEGGRIFLRASQDAYVDGNGRIVTTGTRGGSVEVLGNRVAVMDNAEIDASGTTGGGRIMVGGDYQGNNPDIQNASVTYFGSNASLKADATGVGDGGTVIVWADDTTRAYGSISARGGATGGDGGFVEVSGKEHLTFRARVDTRAQHGRTGTLLLDPNDITIVYDDGGTPTNGSYGGSPWLFEATGDPSTVGWNTLEAALYSTAVSVTTTDGSITIGADYTYDSPYDLNLLAGRDINAQNRQVVNSSSGGITLIAGWNGDLVTPEVGAGPGAINASGATFSTVGGNITLKAKDGITVGSLITSGYDGGEGGSGGHAGHVTVHSVSGDINVTTIEAYGGRGGDDSYNSGGIGGNGGTVSLTADAGTITSGSIDASGGRGGDGGEGGGPGGDGHAVSLTAFGQITVGNINASGGRGGDSYYLGDGGWGGDAGGISLTAGGDISLVNAALSAVGGAGGDGATAYGGMYAATGGGNGGYGGNISILAGGLVSLSNSSVYTSGGRGGDGGAGAIGGYGGAVGGDGGEGGHILIDAGKITLTDSWLEARGGEGGQGGDGYGNGNATFTVTVDGTDLCGGSSGVTCSGQTLSASYGGVVYSFHAPVDQTDADTTAGGIGGDGGSVNDSAGHAIMLKARNDNIELTNSSITFGSGSAGWGGANSDSGYVSANLGPLWATVSTGGGIAASQHYSGGTSYWFDSAWGDDGGVAGRLMLAAKGDVKLTNAWVSAYGSSGDTTNQRIDFLAGWDGIGGAVPAGTPYGGSIVLTDSTIYGAWDSAISWKAGGDILFGTSYASAPLGEITLDAGGNVVLGRLVADYSGTTIDVTAGGAILDGNGSVVNLKAENIYLTSYYGGSVGGLAISADIDNSDDGVSLLDADVGDSFSASYGGISLRVAGDSPGTVGIYDGAISQNSIYFSATRDINIDGSQSFYADNGGGIMLSAGRDVNWESDGYALGTSGSAVVSAGRDINVNTDIYNDAGYGVGSLALIAGRDLNIDWWGSVSSYWLDILLIGSTVTNHGEVAAGNDLDILAGNLNNHGSMSAGNDLTFIAGNVLGADGGEGGGGFSAGHNITGFALGNITLGSGGYFLAGNDVNLTLMGAASTLSLSDGGYILANVPDTITLAFTTRSSGGVMIDGVETTTSLPEGSGLFVMDHYTPAVEGAGLVITHAAPAAGDPCASDPALCKPKDPGESLIEDLVPKLFDSAKADTGSDEDSFGEEDDKDKKKSDDGKDGKKDGKRSQKKAAQCT